MHRLFHMVTHEEDELIVNNVVNKMKSKAISDPCICKVCSCGKHKLCKPLWTCGPALDAHSGNQLDSFSLLYKRLLY